jgi:hypothetical protein
MPAAPIPEQPRKDYQKQNGLSVAGSLDQATIRSLHQDAGTVGSSSHPAADRPMTNPHPELLGGGRTCWCYGTVLMRVSGRSLTKAKPVVGSRPSVAVWAAVELSRLWAFHIFWCTCESRGRRTSTWHGCEDPPGQWPP